MSHAQTFSPRTPTSTSSGAKVIYAAAPAGGGAGAGGANRGKPTLQDVESQLKRGLLTAISLLLTLAMSSMATLLLTFSSHLPPTVTPFFSTTHSAALLGGGVDEASEFVTASSRSGGMHTMVLHLHRLLLRPPPRIRMDDLTSLQQGGSVLEVMVTCYDFLSRAKHVTRIFALVLCTLGCFSVISFACMINVQRSRIGHYLDATMPLRSKSAMAANSSDSRVSSQASAVGATSIASPVVAGGGDGNQKSASSSRGAGASGVGMLSSKDSFNRRSSRTSSTTVSARLVPNDYVSASARFSLQLPTNGDHAQCLETMKRNIMRAEDAEMSAYKARVAKHQFMAYVFHNMRVPFNAIVLGLGQLKTNPSSPREVTDNKELLQMMLDCAETMTNVFDDVTDMGKIEDGLMELEFEEFDMVESLNFICGRLKDILREKQSCIVVNIEESASHILSTTKLLGDKNRVQQILGNFLYNVVAEAGEEGSKIEMSIECAAIYGGEEQDCSSSVSSEEDFICPCTKVGGRARMQTSSAMATFSSFACEHDDFTRLLITVRGNCITGDDQARLFEPCEAFAPSKAEANFGTGLSMARCFAEQVGGFIGVVVAADDENDVEETATETEGGGGSSVAAMRPGPSNSGSNAMFTLALPFPLIHEDVQEVDDGDQVAEAQRREKRKKIKADGKLIIVEGEEELQSENDEEEEELEEEERMHGMGKGEEDVQESKNNGAISGSSSVAAVIDKGCESAAAPAAVTNVGAKEEEAQQQVVVVEDSTRSVLVVEDTKINRMVIKKVLQNLNLNCDEAENGQIAVDLLKAGRRYDLILMDKEMPVMDGHEATRRLRSMGVKTPIVALTANALESDRELFMQAGVDDFQTKPLSREKLVNVLARFGLDFEGA